MLELLLATSKRHSPTYLIRFHCPACRERDVSGEAWTTFQTTWLFWLFPILEQPFHMARGECCGRALVSELAPERLAVTDADGVEANFAVHDQVHPFSGLMLFAAYLTVFVPAVGPILYFYAWMPRGSSRPWFKIACRIWIILHVIAINAVAIALLIINAQRKT